MIKEQLQEFEWLALHIARQYQGNCPAIYSDDLEQEARIGLYVAERTYDKAANASLKTYAATCIHNRLRRFLRDHVRRVSDHREESWDSVHSNQIISPLPLTDSHELMHFAGGSRHEGATDDAVTSNPTKDRLRGLRWGTEGGDLFRRAALIAPLSRAERTLVLRMSRGEDIQRRYYSTSRARQTWRDLIWPATLSDPDQVFSRADENALYTQLDSNERHTTENAAFAVWVMHAVPSVSRRSQKIDRPALARRVVDRASETNDPVIERIAIDLWLTDHPAELLVRFTSPGCVRRICSSDAFVADSARVEVLLRTLRNGVNCLLSGPIHTGTLSVIWDVAAGLSRAIPLFPGLAEELSRDPVLRREGGYILSSIFGRINSDAGIEWFHRANHGTPYESKGNIANGIVNHLKCRSDRPLSLIARRVAAFQLRHADPNDNLNLYIRGLADDQPFVRNSIISSLMSTLKDIQEITPIVHAIEQVIKISARARGTRRPIEMLYVTMHLLALVDPQRAQKLCTEFAKHTETSAALRGHALFWLGELWREERKHADEAELLTSLLGLMQPHHEYALHIAQILTSPLPLARRSRPAEDLGINATFSSPLWRTSWN